MNMNTKCIFERGTVPTDDEIVGLFKCGELPIGFADNPIWEAMLERIQKLPSKYEEKEKELGNLQTKRENIVNELKQIEERQSILKKNLKSIQEQEINLKKELHPWISFKETKYQSTMNLIGLCAKSEKALAKRMQDQLNEDFADFTAELQGDVPLSLVFNAMGLSCETISKLKYLDGMEFLGTSIALECQRYKIPIADQFNMIYCQDLLKANNSFPSKFHEENCAVCSSNTPQLLCDLINEHFQSIDTAFDLNWIKENGINGRVFLGIDYSYLRNEFPQTFKTFRSTLIYFKKIHSSVQ